MKLHALNNILKEKSIEVIFTDYYDTLVHRSVHPNYTLRLWAKHLIKELGLKTTIDNLYFTRQQVVAHLTKTLQCEDVELSYRSLQEEICTRLINEDILEESGKNTFMKVFELADIKAEASVQYINEDTLIALKKFKKSGGKVYLVSDFYGPKSMFKALLQHHQILDLFEDIYSSSSLGKSKHKGSIYPKILSELALDPAKILMIGDNKVSDVTHAKAHKLNAYLMPHKHYLRTNRKNNFGHDYKKVNTVINKLFKDCQKNNAQPYTEYIVFYHVFIERLYHKCKENKIKDLFFLSREGQFLKQIFDSYQEFTIIDETNKINTHYLKISRQASLQIALKDLDVEDFGYLQKKYNNLSVNDFLSAVNCPEALTNQIVTELNIDSKVIVDCFFKSGVFKALKKNKPFADYYDVHRKNNYNAFNTYIRSFKSDIEGNGLTLVDIGWGGTMQESIYKFFDHKIPVTGYYLGLGEIYDIQPKTKRYGLNFSLLPCLGYNDCVLMANMQLYEQFSAADHGSALGYSLEAKDYTLEYHKPEEKWLYETYIKTHQEAMFSLHKKLLKNLAPLCYSQEQMQNSISKMALKVGLFQSVKKLKFLDTLSNGFYQNIGDNQVGISYETPKIKSPIKSVIRFLLTPEKYFRYLVKLKPMLYKKNKAVALMTPMYLIYLYYGFNKYVRFKVLTRFFLLKYNFFK